MSLEIKGRIIACFRRKKQAKVKTVNGNHKMPLLKPMVNILKKVCFQYVWG